MSEGTEVIVPNSHAKSEKSTGTLAERIAAVIAAKADGELDAEALRGKVPEKAIGKDGKLKWSNLDTQVEHEGSKIKLPADPAKMPLDEAIKSLERKKKDEETFVDVHEIIDAFPTDGAVAWIKALRQTYGWANSVPTPGFFGPKPPQFITVEVGPNPEDKVQVPWGGFEIPGIDKPIHTDVTHGHNGLNFVVYGKVMKKEVWILKELADLTREIVKKESIYRGQAIRLRDAAGELDMNNAPQFISVAHVKPEELILPEEVEDLIQTNVWNLIEHTERAVKNHIPLKRGILLESTYGTGKSMAALVTAKKSVDNGWTYIAIDRVQGLRAALEFAKRYQPCVIFAEDIDRTTESRNEQANDLLNILDGVLSKSSQIMVVLTTNHVDNINRAMLRPGRLDAIISLKAPDAQTVERLLRLYGRSLITAKESLKDISQRLSGQVPATIREVVERAKLSIVGKTNSDKLTEKDLLIAAAGMEHHLALLNRPTGRVVSPEEQVGKALAALVGARVAEIVAQATVLQIDSNTESSLDIGMNQGRDHREHAQRRVVEVLTTEMTKAAE